MDAIKIVDQILEPLVAEIKELRQEVLYSRDTGRNWERKLQKYDELIIRKLQTEYIRERLLDEKVATQTDAQSIRV